MNEDSQGSKPTEEELQAIANDVVRAVRENEEEVDNDD